MRIGSLCSGAGALDMAVEHVFGATTAWHCEIDAAATKALGHRYPGVPNYGDLTTTNWEAVEPVDILTGGYPCQPFSHAGQRKGADDERHIWPSVREAIRRVRPRLAILENVAGHRSLGFDRVLGDLAEDGLHVRWTSLRAADVGSCHARERLWIVVADPARKRWNQRWTQPARLFRGSHAAVGGHADVNLLPTPTSRDSKGHNQRHDDTCLTGALLQTPSAADGGGSRKARGGTRSDEPLLAGQAIEMHDSWGKYDAAVHRWELATRPAPSPTELGKTGNPRLSPAFSEWMMGWPDGWVTDVPGISRNDKLRIIGNGVVPQCAAAALTHLLSLERAA